MLNDRGNAGAAVILPPRRAGDCKTFGVTPDHGRCIDASNNVTEAEPVEPSEAVVPKSMDARLIDELVSRAQAEGLR